jgi:hypothetical protein
MVLCVARTFLSRHYGLERWNCLLHCKITNFYANNYLCDDFSILPAGHPLQVSKVSSAGDVKILTFGQNYNLNHGQVI